MSGTQSTMFAAPSYAITGKRRIEPQHFDGSSRRSAVDMAATPQSLCILRLKSQCNFNSFILSGTPMDPLRNLPKFIHCNFLSGVPFRHSCSIRSLRPMPTTTRTVARYRSVRLT